MLLLRVLGGLFVSIVWGFLALTNAQFASSFAEDTVLFKIQGYSVLETHAYAALGFALEALAAIFLVYANHLNALGNQGLKWLARFAALALIAVSWHSAKTSFEARNLARLAPAEQSQDVYGFLKVNLAAAQERHRSLTNTPTSGMTRKERAQHNKDFADSEARVDSLTKQVQFAPRVVAAKSAEYFPEALATILVFVGIVGWLIPFGSAHPFAHNNEGWSRARPFPPLDVHRTPFAPPPGPSAPAQSPEEPGLAISVPGSSPSPGLVRPGNNPKALEVGPSGTVPAAGPPGPPPSVTLSELCLKTPGPAYVRSTGMPPGPPPEAGRARAIQTGVDRGNVVPIGDALEPAVRRWARTYIEEAEGEFLTSSAAWEHYLQCGSVDATQDQFTATFKAYLGKKQTDQKKVHGRNARGHRGIRLKALTRATAATT